MTARVHSAPLPSASLFAAIAFMTVLVLNEAEAQRVWTKSPDNPVLPYVSSSVNDPSGYTHLLEPTVLYDSSAQLFTMWFTSGTSIGGSTFCISTARSQNGTDWYLYARNPVLVSGAAGSFDAGSIDASTVVRTDQEYLVYYTGTNQGKYSIGGATSPDRITWQKFTSNPVLATGVPGSWDARNVGWCNVLLKDGIYYMWYNGTSSDHWEGIGLATSTDGRQWNKYAGNPVFVHSSSGWDSYEVATPAVLYSNGWFYMFYQGLSTPGPCSFGWAYSKDGIAWTRGAADPILHTDFNWETDLGTADVLFVNNKFHMWFSGRSGSTLHWQIGYASSNYVPLSVADLTDEVPERFMLHQNFPNPFNPSTTIRFELPHRSQVVLTVINSLGQRVTDLVSGDVDAGSHEVKFDAAGFPSGVYFYRLQVGNAVQTRKFVLLK